MAHNHPSGRAEPSQWDIQVTGRIKSALELVGTVVIDDLVIGGSDTVSFAERGLLT